MSESKGGGLDPELKMELSNYNDRVTPGRANQITLARVNTPTRNILKKFDNNGDGRIDANEIQTIVSTLVAEKFKSKAFKIGLIILFIFTAILLGAMFGLTWAVVAALKDTQVQGGILLTNDREATPVLVGNMDLTISGSVLVARNSSTVVSTSRIQSPGTISGKTPFDKLLAMQNLVFVSADNSSLAVAIQGIARIPSNSSDGFTVRFQTASGVLTLADGVWTASELSGPLLEHLFNVSDGSRRRRLMEDNTVNTYVICEDGECGEAMPCGYDDFPPCPTTSDPTEDGENDNGGSSGDENSGIVNGICTTQSAAVTNCRAGLTSCYGPLPSDLNRQRYLNQTGCLSRCASIGWSFNGAQCEAPLIKGTLRGPSRMFCCM